MIRKEYQLLQNKSKISEIERLRWGMLILACRGDISNSVEEIESLDYEGLVRLTTK